MMTEKISELKFLADESLVKTMFDSFIENSFKRELNEPETALAKHAFCSALSMLRQLYTQMPEYNYGCFLEDVMKEIDELYDKNN
jgi:hypothetical protein